jgi:hypothetical protein
LFAVSYSGFREANRCHYVILHVVNTHISNNKSPDCPRTRTAQGRAAFVQAEDPFEDPPEQDLEGEGELGENENLETNENDQIEMIDEPEQDNAFDYDYYSSDEDYTPIGDNNDETQSDNEPEHQAFSATLVPISYARAATVHSNQVKYKQPIRISEKQKSVICEMNIDGHTAQVLIDSGSTTDMISPQFAAVHRCKTIPLEEPMGLQLAVSGSRSTISNGVWALLELKGVSETRYFDLVNSDRFDIVLGTPFLYDHGFFIDIRDGVLRYRDGQIVDLSYRRNMPSVATRATRAPRATRVAATN